METVVIINGNQVAGGEMLRLTESGIRVVATENRTVVTLTPPAEFLREGFNIGGWGYGGVEFWAINSPSSIVATIGESRIEVRRRAQGEP